MASYAAAVTSSSRTGLRLPVVRALAPRDPHESHRTASSLELLTDLCFVVAIAQAASGLHHAVVEGHVGSGVAGFAMAFFAIWWAWLNFTWFASAYDNDDVLYRLLTIGQIVGSLVLASGVAGLFEGQVRLVVIGYVIMRLALIAQWLRAARGDPEHRKTCLRYAVGIAIVQLGWVSVLLLDHLPSLLFLGLAVAELAVPIIAERAGETPWHPHHVAERYGLFFIIVLGETILSSTTAISAAVTDATVDSGQIFLVVIAGVLIVFSLWWLYFARETGPVLERIKAAGTSGDYLWGFGHYVIFASAAAVGAGLAARVDFWTGTAEHPVPALGSAALVTVPVALLLTAMWTLNLRHHDAGLRTLVPFAVAVVAILASTFTPYPELLTGVVCALLVAVEVTFAELGPASRTESVVA